MRRRALLSTLTKVIKTVLSKLPIILTASSDNGYVLDYKLYGESVQNGTPTPETPVDVESVGELIATVPQEYQQVEYIESTGTQYIDTGVIPSNTVGFKIKMSLSEIMNDIYRYGCREDSGNTRFIMANADGAVYFGFGTVIKPSGNNVSSWAINVNETFTASLNYLNSRFANVNDINNISIGNISTTFTQTLIMFGRNSSGTISSSAQKIYYNQITDGNNIIRNFIPCYRKSDNVVGMYDTVNKEFYTNKGTGEFLKGSDVNIGYIYKIPIRASGKNLFDISKSKGFDSVYGGFKNTKNGNVLTVECTVAARTGFLELGTFPKGKYTLSLEGRERTSKFIQIGDVLGSLTNLGVAFQGNANTFTLSKTSKVWLCDTGFMKGTSNISNIQLECGSTATEYEPYQEPIITDIYLDEPLYKAGTYADYIDFENQTVVRNIKKFEIKSSDYMSSYTWLKKTGVYVAGKLDDKYDRSTNALSNRNYNSWNETQTAVNSTGMWVGVSNNLFYWIGILTYLGLDTLDEFKTWLDDNPTYVWYGSRHPTMTPITLPKLPIFKGTTIYSVDTNIQPSNMEVTYYSNER